MQFIAAKAETKTMSAVKLVDFVPLEVGNKVVNSIELAFEGKATVGFTISYEWGYESFYIDVDVPQYQCQALHKKGQEFKLAYLTSEERDEKITSISLWIRSCLKEIKFPPREEWNFVVKKTWKQDAEDRSYQDQISYENQAWGTFTHWSV